MRARRTRVVALVCLPALALLAAATAKKCPQLNIKSDGPIGVTIADCH